MHRAWLLLLVACSSRSEHTPEVPPAKPPPPIADAVAPADAAVPDAAVPDTAAPRDPIHALTKIKLEPSHGARLIGADHERLFTVDGDGSLVTTRLDTGAEVERWKPTELAELGRSPWRPGGSTKTGKPELDFDLAGRLDGVRREAGLVRAVMREAGTDQLAGLAISPDGTTTIVVGGDLLYWLRDDQPPALLDVGASYEAAVAPDGKRVAYNGCTSPCGSYALRLVGLADTMHPKIAKLAEPSGMFWVPDGSAVIARSGTCVVRVDAATLASKNVVCDAAIEQVEPAPAHDGVAVLVRARTGRELRIYAADGKLARTVALPSKLAGVVATLALARDGKALVSIAGARFATETFLVGAGGTIKLLAVPGKDSYASAAIWIDNDRAAALFHDTIYLLDAAALLR